MRTNSLGIDPDSKDLSIALWRDDGPVWTRVIHVEGSATNYQMIAALRRATPIEFEGNYPTVAAIEGQQIDGRRARPRDLFKLAHMTGAALLWLNQQLPAMRLLVPSPTEWKGSVAKHAMQARLYTDLGWGYQLVGSGLKRYARPLCIPNAFTHITPGQWKHVGDALLLARWAHQQQSIA